MRKSSLSIYRSSVLFLLTFALLLRLQIPLAAEKQTGMHKIAILSFGDLQRPLIKGLRYGLRKLGYLEGKNLLLDMPLLTTVSDVRALVDGYARSKSIDVIVTAGGIVTSIAKDLIPKHPIVFIAVLDPVSSGIVESLARPGISITGITYDASVVTQGKRLEIFKAFVPSVRRVLVLYDDREENRVRDEMTTVVRNVALRADIKLEERPVKSVQEAARIVSSFSRSDGIFTVCTTLFSNLHPIAMIARERSLPLSGCSTTHVEDGALLAYAPDLYQIGFRGASFVDRILKGTKPQNLPVENPTKFELIVNLKTANAIGITIPPEVLQQADKVIK
jgi:putative tryptophan/tyrosine transport system substrate-binding protein